MMISVSKAATMETKRFWYTQQGILSDDTERLDLQPGVYMDEMGVNYQIFRFDTVLVTKDNTIVDALLTVEAKPMSGGELRVFICEWIETVANKLQIQTKTKYGI